MDLTALWAQKMFEKVHKIHALYAFPLEPEASEHIIAYHIKTGDELEKSASSLIPATNFIASKLDLTTDQIEEVAKLFEGNASNNRLVFPTVARAANFLTAMYLGLIGKYIKGGFKL